MRGGPGVGQGARVVRSVRCSPIDLARVHPRIYILLVSPILADIYLHYCLDEWFEHVVKKHCRGEACLIRYADDFVCAFEREGDAERFYQVLGKRLETLW